MRDRVSVLRIPRSNALLLRHRDYGKWGLLRSSHDTRSAKCLDQNVDNVMFVNGIMVSFKLSKEI